MVLNPECAKLFGGTKKATQTLSNMQKNTTLSSTHPPASFQSKGPNGYVGKGVPFGDDIAWTARWTWKKKLYREVFIDQNGPFFNSSNQYPWDGGALVGADTRNAITILHEMRHWNGQPKPSDHNNKWNKEIYDKCVKKNAVLGTDPSGGPSPTSA